MNQIHKVVTVCNSLTGEIGDVYLTDAGKKKLDTFLTDLLVFGMAVQPDLSKDSFVHMIAKGGVAL